MFSSWPIALIIRRQTPTPALSRSAASSSARLRLSASAVSPYHHSIRQAARQMSISDTIGRDTADSDEVAWAFRDDVARVRGLAGMGIFGWWPGAGQACLPPCEDHDQVLRRHNPSRASTSVSGGSTRSNSSWVRRIGKSGCASSIR